MDVYMCMLRIRTEGLVVLSLSLHGMNTTNGVQIRNKIVWSSHRVNTFEKDIDPTILPSAIDN